MVDRPFFPGRGIERVDDSRTFAPVERRVRIKSTPRNELLPRKLVPVVTPWQTHPRPDLALPSFHPCRMNQGRAGTGPSPQSPNANRKVPCTATPNRFSSHLTRHLPPPTCLYSHAPSPPSRLRVSLHLCRPYLGSPNTLAYRRSRSARRSGSRLKSELAQQRPPLQSRARRAGSRRRQDQGHAREAQAGSSVHTPLA